MKAQKLVHSFYTLASLIFILGIATSCTQTDLITPVPETGVLSPGSKLAYDPDMSTRQHLEYPEKESESSGDRTINPFAIYKLIDFSFSTIQDGQLKEKSGEVGKSDPVLVHDAYVNKDEIILSGEGQGWSEEFGRSVISAHFVFDPVRMELRGEVTCAFSPSGDVVKLMLEGSGPLEIVKEFDGPHAAMVMNVSRTIGTGKYRQTVFEGKSYFLNASALFNPELEGFSSYLMTIGDFKE